MTRPQPLPDIFELSHLVHHVTQEWAGLETRCAGQPLGSPTDLALEFGVALPGPEPQWLVLRGHPAAAADLAEASTGDPSAREQAGEAFRELTRLVAQRLAQVLPCLDAAPNLPFDPLASRPGDWPSATPDRAVALRLQQHPMELRLWSLDTVKRPTPREAAPADACLCGKT